MNYKEFDMTIRGMARVIEVKTRGWGGATDLIAVDQADFITILTHILSEEKRTPLVFKEEWHDAVCYYVYLPLTLCITTKIKKDEEKPTKT